MGIYFIGKETKVEEAKATIQKNFTQQCVVPHISWTQQLSRFVMLCCSDSFRGFKSLLLRVTLLLIQWCVMAGGCCSRMAQPFLLPACSLLFLISHFTLPLSHLLPSVFPKLSFFSYLRIQGSSSFISTAQDQEKIAPVLLNNSELYSLLEVTAKFSTSPITISQPLLPSEACQVTMLQGWQKIQLPGFSLLWNSLRCRMARPDQGWPKTSQCLRLHTKCASSTWRCASLCSSHSSPSLSSLPHLHPSLPVQRLSGGGGLVEESEWRCAHPPVLPKVTQATLSACDRECLSASWTGPTLGLYAPLIPSLADNSQALSLVFSTYLCLFPIVPVSQGITHSASFLQGIYCWTQLLPSS